MTAVRRDLLTGTAFHFSIIRPQHPEIQRSTVMPFSYKSKTTCFHCWTSASQPLNRDASSSSGNASDGGNSIQEGPTRIYLLATH